MLIIDIETTGLKISEHRIKVIGTILYDTKTKEIIKDQCFNVIKNEMEGNEVGIIEVKESIAKLLLEYVSIVAFNGINFDMPFILKWLNQSPCIKSINMYNDLDIKYLDFCAISKKYTNCYISLNNICILNEIQVCKSSNGAQAVIWAKEQNWTALSEYCMQDVFVLLQLTQHALEHGLYFATSRIIGTTMPSETILMCFDDKFQPVLAFDKLLMLNKPKECITKICLDDIFE